MSCTGAGQNAHGSNSLATLPPTRGDTAMTPAANAWYASGPSGCGESVHSTAA